MITHAIENKILAKLERIENLLFEIAPKIEKRKIDMIDMDENNVLRLIEDGNEEYRKNQTMNFDDFINNQCPHLIKK